VKQPEDDDGGAFMVNQWAKWTCEACGSFSWCLDFFLYVPLGSCDEKRKEQLVAAMLHCV
jgi:hypothetical protein